jgi:putative transposase
MSTKGSCYDNAAMESFYGRYKTSSFRGHVFAGEDMARSNAFEYIEIFYNRFRKHSSLGYKSPVQFENEKIPPMGEFPASLPACRDKN